MGRRVEEEEETAGLVCMGSSEQDKAVSPSGDEGDSSSGKDGVGEVARRGLPGPLESIPVAICH